MPAKVAVSRAEEKGYPIEQSWLTRDAGKHGVQLRTAQLPGRHKVEVEWGSLATYLFDNKKSVGNGGQSGEDGDEDDPIIAERIRKARDRKEKERPLD
jgi:hypothetical protein